MNILSWNIRGLGKPKRRRLIRDILYEHLIDLMSLQETKKEKYKDRMLRNLSLTINNWIFLPSVGNSGGILLGINENKLEVIDTLILSFSIIILIKNKFLGFVWMFTSIYGPTLMNQRNNFLARIKYNHKIFKCSMINRWGF
jgi:nitrate reductase NapE component